MVLVTTAMLPVVAGRISDWLIAVVVRGGQVTPSPPPPYLATEGGGLTSTIYINLNLCGPLFLPWQRPAAFWCSTAEPPHAEYK